MNNKIIPQSISIESWKGACMCHARSICRQTLHEKQKSLRLECCCINCSHAAVNSFENTCTNPDLKRRQVQFIRLNECHGSHNTTQIVLTINPSFRCSTLCLPPYVGMLHPLFWRSTLLFWWPALCSDASPFALQLMPLLICYIILSQQLEIYVSLKLPRNFPTTQKP